MFEWPIEEKVETLSQLMKSIFLIRDKYDLLLKTQSNKVLLGFNIRFLYRIIHSFVCFTEEKYVTQDKIFKLIASEVNRTIVDRISETADRIVFNTELH